MLDKVIPVVLRAIALGVKGPAQRNQLYIKTLKQLKLDPEHPPADFSAAYAYALVEYAIKEEGEKSDTLIELFAEPEIKEAFHQAFKQWDHSLFTDALDKRLNWDDYSDWNFIANAIRDQDIDIQREVPLFFAVFLDVVWRSQTPKEQLQTGLLTDMQQDLKQMRAQLAQVSELTALPEQFTKLLQGQLQALLAPVQTADPNALEAQLRDWFDVLGYGWEDHKVIEDRFFEWIITIPVRRKRYDRIVVRGVTGEAGIADLNALQAAVEQHGTDEGWLVSKMRVSSGVRKQVKEDDAYEAISCYTLDELLDEDADFSQYLAWLETEIQQRRIDQDYIPLGCSKDEVDPKTKQKIGVSHYGEEDGWIEGYVNQWLADSSKEHLSVLGEFGTGKTWFAMHYAWLALQKYKDAKQKKVERPRLPLVIPLRDYAKAVSVESLFSEFFFRKYEIPIPGYSAFKQLNRMGKLLLIFDGFDEMADRINRQAMIDNFWELAKVVVPGAKAILTCRTEHFPDAIEGRRLLGAELKASTDKLTGEPPQFEVLELAKFSDQQIAQLLERQAQEATVEKVLGNPQLLDLARRPVMVELILEALPDIEAGKPIDMSRVYLYAVTRKMEKDITSERTFTSLADKLYFLCELSWEMLSTDQMSLNYRAFPERLEQMFGDRVQEERELDHWRYDMMGQTMLIRNSEGDYSPAHRSLLEFFVAYKIVASLGVLAEDFTVVARQQSNLSTESPQVYGWDAYFKRRCNGEGHPEAIAPLAKFASLSMDQLLPLLSQAKLAKAVLDLAHPMVDDGIMRERLLPLLWATREKSLKEIGYLGGNVTQLMLAKTPHGLSNSDLSRVKLRGVDFVKTYLHRINFQGAHLTEAIFSKVLGNVNSVAFSPDGKRLAIGDGKGSVQVWDVATGQVVLMCTGHSGGVRSVAFSPDGERLASGSDDNTVKLWSSERGECVATLEGHENTVLSVAFSPDGERLASGSDDKMVKLWSSESGDCVTTLAGHENTVLSVAFSPDGERLASGSDDKTVKLWSSESGDCVATLAGHENTVLSVAFSPDGERLASGSDDKTVKLWSSESGDCVATLAGHENTVLSVAFSPDGERLASGSDDQTVKLWSSESGECVATLAGHENLVRSVAFSPDGERLASGSDDQTVKLWSSESGECVATLAGHENRVRSVAFSPDGERLASGSSDKTAKLWSSERGECVATLEGHKDWVRSVAFSPDGERLASGSSDKTVKLWSSRNGNCVATLEGHENTVWSVAFSPDGERLASGSDDKTVKLWSSKSGDCVATLEGHENTVRSVAFSPDGERLASGGSDKTVKLWSSKSGDCVVTLEGHKDWVWSVAFSPDGERLASGSSDKTVKLWSSENGNCVVTLEGHENTVRSVAFSPDGERLASGSSDKTVKLWSSRNGNCVATLEGHENRVRSVAFSPDGERLASGSDDNTIRIWDVATGECLHVIDERVCGGMDITGVEGLSVGQRAALRLMGAIDNNG